MVKLARAVAFASSVVLVSYMPESDSMIKITIIYGILLAMVLMGCKIGGLFNDYEGNK